MCGIFAYVGENIDAAQKTLEGLKLLEYRGYDSWGIAVKKGNTLVFEKHIGKIGSAQTVLPESFLGIGHTRWATHGGVTQKNAHPHLDCAKKIAVVHNGIVENYESLKKELIQKGHHFVSDTDTEVIPHLIEEFLKTEGFAASVRDTFGTISGLNAIVVAYAPSQEIIAAKNGSPLVVGENKEGYFIASDASGIVKHTKKVMFLKDNEMVILGKQMQLVSLPKGEKLKAVFETIHWNIEEVTTGKYPHFMLKEIHEQPFVVKTIVKQLKNQIHELSGIIKKSRGTFFIASGTAFHACLGGVYLFSKIAKRHVNTAVASEFNYLEHFLNNKSLIIALSQSGETIDVIEPLKLAKEKGATIASVVNTIGSTIYRMGDYTVLLQAGPEKAVASTKAYTAKLAVLLLLSFSMNDEISKAENLLSKAAKEMTRLLKDSSVEKIKKLAEILASKEHLYIIGRGASFPTALEAALKIKEVSYIHTEGLAGGELKHGTIALIEKGTPCIVFAPNDETRDAMISNATEIKARGGYIIGISSQKSPIFDYWIPVYDCGDAAIVTQIVPIQLLAYFLALKRGFDPDKPRNLAKSVTVK